MKTRNNYSGRAVLLLLAVISALFMGTACSDSSEDPYSNPGPGPSANEVSIQNMAFSPQTLTISVNTTVKWTNKDAVTHTATSTTAVFDSGNLSNGGTFSYKFTTAGTFNYYCKTHPAMTATIKVQ